MRIVKFVSIVIGSSLLALSCTQSYKIEGNWSEGAGKIVYLQQGPDKEKTNIDSVVVSPDGNFEFDVKAEVAVYTIKPEVVDRGTDVMVSEVPVMVSVEKEIRTKKDSTTYEMTRVSATGAEHEVYEKGIGLITTSSLMQFGRLLMLYGISKGDFDQSPDSVKAQYDMLEADLRKNMLNYVDSAKNNYGVAYFIKEYMIKKFTADEVLAAYNNLTDRVKHSAPGIELKQAIDALNQVSMGGTAPDIKLPTPDGEELSMYSLRGNYVLLDFWASWCGPCLREAPNVKALYDKYHAKGFQVFGVSLDNDKEAWIAAIEKHGLNWHQVSSLKGWECPAAKQYNVTGIPRMYILDPDGKIIAMDLRGKELTQFVDNLYK